MRAVGFVFVVAGSWGKSVRLLLAMIAPRQVYADHTDDFVRMSMNQPANRIEEAMSRMEESRPARDLR